MAETYADWVNAMGSLFQFLEEITDPAAANPTDNEAINIILPRAIEYAEQRIYREIDLQETTEFTSGILAANNRYITMTAGTIVLESMNVITPVGYTPDQLGAVRHPLQRVSVEFMNFVCADATTPDTTGLPSYYTVKDNATAMVGPAPDASYGAEFVGTFRPNPLSSTNTTTILTTYCPDFFNAATCIFLAGFQRDFGSMADDPKLAQSWQAQYDALKQSVNVEEWRKGGFGPAWQPFSPTPLAMQPRT